MYPYTCNWILSGTESQLQLGRCILNHESYTLYALFVYYRLGDFLVWYLCNANRNFFPILSAVASGDFLSNVSCLLITFLLPSISFNFHFPELPDAKVQLQSFFLTNRFPLQHSVPLDTLLEKDILHSRPTGLSAQWAFNLSSHRQKPICLGPSLVLPRLTHDLLAPLLSRLLPGIVLDLLFPQSRFRPSTKSYQRRRWWGSKAKLQVADSYCL